MKYLEISDLACERDGDGQMFAYVNKNELIKTTGLTRTKRMDVCTRLKSEIPHCHQRCGLFSILNCYKLLVF